MQRERFASLDDALTAVEARLRHVGYAARRETRSFLSRDFAPADQVSVRAELRGPRGLRVGVDVRGDGAAVAWTGRLARRPIDPVAGEDAYAALRRVSCAA